MRSQKISIDEFQPLTKYNKITIPVKFSVDKMLGIISILVYQINLITVMCHFEGW